MPQTPDWTPCLDTLRSLRHMVLEVQAVAHQPQENNTPDALSNGCAELAKALASCQPGLAQALAQDKPPAEVQELLSQLKSSLNALQDQTTRLQAGTTRALNVLFPSDQVQTYSRLGKGYGAQPRAGTGYLKA